MHWMLRKEVAVLAFVLNYILLALITRPFGVGGWELTHYWVAFLGFALAMTFGESWLLERLVSREEERSQRVLNIAAVVIGLCVGIGGWWWEKADLQAEAAQRERRDREVIGQSGPPPVSADTLAAMERLRATCRDTSGFAIEQ